VSAAVKSTTETVPEPEQHAQAAKKHVQEEPKPQEAKREPVDAGFCILPYGAETGAYEPGYSKVSHRQAHANFTVL
jgi:hypothetical protein